MKVRGVVLGICLARSTVLQDVARVFGYRGKLALIGDATSYVKARSRGKEQRMPKIGKVPLHNHYEEARGSLGTRCQARFRCINPPGDVSGALFRRGGGASAPILTWN